MALKKPSMVKTYAKTSHGNLTRVSRKKGSGNEPQYIVVHYTGCGAPARNFCIAFQREGADAGASADFFIGSGRYGSKDDGVCYRYNGNVGTRYSWHCGDGHGKYSITNRNSIGIEVVSDGEDFTEKQIAKLREVVRYYMQYYGIPAKNVVRHYDASRKECPEPYAGSAARDKRWKALHERITKA